MGSIPFQKQGRENAGVCVCVCVNVDRMSRARARVIRGNAFLFSTAVLSLSAPFFCVRRTVHQKYAKGLHRSHGSRDTNESCDEVHVVVNCAVGVLVSGLPIDLSQTHVFEDRPADVLHTTHGSGVCVSEKTVGATT